MVNRISRRGLLILGAGCSSAALAVGCSTPPTDSSAPSTDASAPSTDSSFSGWLKSRASPYYIAHRGAGSTVPEHTLPSYRTALEWGARAIEISVVRSSDGVLYCHHDLEWDRTTTLTGRTADLPSTQVDEGRVKVPWLGPRWGGGNMPVIPRLTQALDEVGDAAVLCIEAKDDSGFDEMIELLDERGHLDRTMVKCSRASRRLDQSHQMDLPVFAYLGAAEATTASARTAVNGMSAHDAIGIPIHRFNRELVSDDVFRAATQGGIPTWAYVTHRRAEVARLGKLGVAGFMTPAVGYLSGALARTHGSDFEEGSIPPGVITNDPYSEWHALGWDVPGAVQVGQGGKTSYVALGNLSPVTAVRFTIRVRIRPQSIPAEGGFAVGFGFPDDAPADPAPGMSGFLASVRPTGELFLHRVRGTDLQPLSSTAGPVLADDIWTPLQLAVHDGEITWSNGEASTHARVTSGRGYLHMARLGTRGHIAVDSIEIV